LDYIKQILGNQKRQRLSWGAIIGTFLGLFLLLSAVQLYLDFQSLLSGGDNNSHYVSVNKKVRLLDMLNTSPSFSQKEIDTLLQHPLIDDVGIFTANRFKVSASSRMIGFRTALFFESVEEDFLDVPLDKFYWKEGGKDIPVIISRDYLALYNFGFAPSQGLPPITQNTITKVPVDVTINGRGLTKTFKGKIVGFSDRFNSVLVPQSFMDWANKNYGSSPNKTISRLILKTSNPYSKELQTFLSNKNYEVSRGKLIGGQFGILLKLVLGLIAFIGLVLVFLSILLLLLQFELLITQANKDIALFLQLGYQPKHISDFLNKRMLLTFGAVLLAALVLLIIVHFLIAAWLETQSIIIPSLIHWIVVLVALLIGGLFAVYGKNRIERQVLALFK